MAESALFDWSGDDDPAAEFLESLPVNAVVTHQGRAIGWWDGEELRPVKVAGIWDGTNVIPDPANDPD